MPGVHEVPMVYILVIFVVVANGLGEAAALDLVAVRAGLELLVVGLVLGGHESRSDPAREKRRREINIGCK